MSIVVNKGYKLVIADIESKLAPRRVYLEGLTSTKCIGKVMPPLSGEQMKHYTGNLRHNIMP